MIITITGSNVFGRSTALEALVQAFVDEHTAMAVERFDGEEAGVERMRESIHSLPFLTARKLVILKMPSSQKSFTESIDAILEDIPETTDLIIIEPKLDKRLAYYKTLKKVTDFQDFPELDSAGLSTWAVAYAQSKNAKLAAKDAKKLVDRVGASQQILRQEIDKLAVYATDITSDTIELLTDYLPQSTVFELLDAAFAGDIQRAMRLYAEQRSLRVEPQAILAMIAWQLHTLVVVKAGGGRSVADIAKEAKLNPFVVRKSQGIVRALPLSRLRELVQSLLILDTRLKRQSIDADEAVQLYILGLAQ